MRNEVTASVRSDQDSYGKKLLKSFKGNTKKLFGFMRRHQTVKMKVTTLKTSDGKLTLTDEEMVDILVGQFQSVFVDEGLDPINGIIKSVINVVQQWIRSETSF